MSEPDKNGLKAQVTARVKEALDRADELGGDLRDYLQDRWAHDPRVAGVRARIDRFRGKAATVPPRAAPKPATAAPAGEAASSTSASAKPVAAPIGLGNPGLPAQIYGKNSCAWTGRAITILEKHKVDYDYLDLEQQENEKFLPLLSTETHQSTVPYVFLRGKFIGGYNALAEVERLGQLEVALMTPAEREKAPAHLRMIEIVARPNTDEVAPAESMEPPAASE
jgi:glutaredoxin